MINAIPFPQILYQIINRVLLIQLLLLVSFLYETSIFSLILTEQLSVPYDGGKWQINLHATFQKFLCIHYPLDVTFQLQIVTETVKHDYFPDKQKTSSALKHSVFIFSLSHNYKLS